MAQLSNKERQILKTLLETDMARIEQRLYKIETDLAKVETDLSDTRADLNRVKREIIEILGLRQEQSSTRAKKSSPHMVAGGDSEGKVVYVYPTGNSEDY